MPRIYEIDETMKPTVARNMLNSDVWLVCEFDNADKVPRIIERGMTSKRLWALADILTKEADRRHRRPAARPVEKGVKT